LSECAGCNWSVAFVDVGEATGVERKGFYLI